MHKVIPLNLSNANFKRASLRRTNFRRVNLTGSILEKANLERAILEGANLEYANLKDANFEGAVYDDDTKFPEGFDPDKAGMRHINSLTEEEKEGYQYL